MPEDQNIIVTSLPEYVQENRDQLIRNVVLGGNTIRHMVPQTGIKSKAAINYLDVDPEFQEGLGCEFTPQEGGIELTQRQIETGIIKVDMSVCPDKLIGKYAEYLVKIGAGEQDLPFEQWIVDGIVEGINAKMEKAVWQGDTTSTDPDLKHFDGLLKLASEEEDTIQVSFASTASAWDKIKAIIMAFPEEVLEKGRVAVFVPAEVFRSFMLEMVEKNFYHYDGAHNEAPNEFVFPGTNVTVVKANGLNRTGILYGTYERNLYYGCDLEGDKEEVEILWNPYKKIFQIHVRWNAGVQTAFPQFVVVGYTGEVPPSGDGTIYGPTTLAFEKAVQDQAPSPIGAGYAASNGSALSASTDADWLTPSFDTGAGVLRLDADAYIGESGSPDPRTAKVIISAEGCPNLEITVSQPVNDPLG